MWPTLNNVLCQSRQEISDYFDSFLSQIDGKSKLNQFVYQSVDENYCVCSGIYTFQLKDGVKAARFTFTLQKVDDECKILHHHSSLMPE